MTNAYAIVGILFASIIGAIVLSAIPDPNRMVVNSLPNTTPDIKTPANQVLDLKDSVDTAKDTMSLWKNVYVWMLGLGVPSVVIGGLIFGRR